VSTGTAVSGDDSQELMITSVSSPGADVTAVVISHNSARHLSDLADVLTSGTLAPIRMLVVDNASTDDTIARAGAAGFDTHATGTNHGFGAACNVALEMVATDFMLIANPDVRPDQNALDRMVAALLARPGAAVAGVAFNRPHRARRFSRLTANVWSFLPGLLRQATKRFDSEIDLGPVHEPVAVDYVVGAFMLCRVSALRSVGGFDEDFFLYSEEEDLCRRLGGQGWEILFVPDVTAGHRHSTSSEGVNGAAMAPFRFHSLFVYYRKHHGRPYAECARWTIAACILFDCVFRAVSGREQAYELGAVLSPFRSLATVRRRWDKRHAKLARDSDDEA
jgi:N-acetylglucosaminyl-diphospho-decaprenol L-rhamnosyltransferase